PDRLVFHGQGAAKILDHIAARLHRNAAVGIDLALEYIAENQKLRVLVARWDIAGQGEQLAIAEDIVVLDDGVDHQVGAAAAHVVEVGLAIGEAPVQHHAGLLDIIDEGLSLHTAKRAGTGDCRNADSAKHNENQHAEPA